MDCKKDKETYAERERSHEPMTKKLVYFGHIMINDYTTASRTKFKEKEIMLEKLAADKIPYMQMSDI